MLPSIFTVFRPGRTCFWLKCAPQDRENRVRDRERDIEKVRQIFLLGIRETCEVLAYRLKTDLFFKCSFNVFCFGVSGYVDACFRLSMVLRCRFLWMGFSGWATISYRFIFSSMKLLGRHGALLRWTLALRLAISLVYELDELHPCARTAPSCIVLEGNGVGRTRKAPYFRRFSKWPFRQRFLSSWEALISKSEKRLNWPKACGDMFAVIDPKNWWPFDGSQWTTPSQTG